MAIGVLSLAPERGAAELLFSRAGGSGLPGFALLVLGSFVLTAIFLGVAAFVFAGTVGRRAASLLVWMVAPALLAARRLDRADL
jgi:hypothetical protein